MTRCAPTARALRSSIRRLARGAAIVAGVLALLAGCNREHGTVAPSFERMLVQPRYEPYGESNFFPDGRAMRIPPEGTVSRERLADSALVAAGVTTGAATGTATGMASGAETVSIPLPVSDELLATGQSRFGVYCAVCHGVLGDGNSVVGHNMVECPPPSLLSPAVRALPPATLYQVIANGFGRMPSYAAQLSVSQRWAVVAYVRRLQSMAPRASESGVIGATAAGGCGARR